MIQARQVEHIRALGLLGIMLLVLTTVTLGAGPIPLLGTREISEDRYEAVVVKDVMIPMRDGIKLAADIYRPAIDGVPLEDKLPILLQRTPYGKEVREVFVEQATYFAQHRYVVVVQDCRGQRFVIDEQKVRQDARYDGKWVLTTNTNLSAKAAALKYKQLWMVESIFRSMKSLLETRPIFHKCDATIRGHVFCSFLALLLRKELENRLEQKGLTIEWADVIRELDDLMEMEITVSDKHYMIRSDTAGTVAKVFSACGVALPPMLSQC